MKDMGDPDDTLVRRPGQDEDKDYPRIDGERARARVTCPIHPPGGGTLQNRGKEGTTTGQGRTEMSRDDTPVR